MATFDGRGVRCRMGVKGRSREWRDEMQAGRGISEDAGGAH